MGWLIANLVAILMAGIVGFFGYGVSLALLVFALCRLGSARTGAYFRTAPFLGAVAAILFLRDQITVQLTLAGVLMAISMWLHLTEDHEHEHMHEPMEHTYTHIHDAHQHAHDGSESTGEDPLQVPNRSTEPAAN